MLNFSVSQASLNAPWRAKAQEATGILIEALFAMGRSRESIERTVIEATREALSGAVSGTIVQDNVLIGGIDMGELASPGSIVRKYVKDCPADLRDTPTGQESFLAEVQDAMANHFVGRDYLNGEQTNYFNGLLTGTELGWLLQPSASSSAPIDLSQLKPWQALLRRYTSNTIRAMLNQGVSREQVEGGLIHAARRALSSESVDQLSDHDIVVGVDGKATGSRKTTCRLPAA